LSTIIRTLIVDDSAFVRKMVREMLSRSPFIEVVGTARDGAEALEMVETLKPDVVTCDLIMPVCDGVSFVRQQMERHPIPILLLTSTPEDGERAMEAMEAGAVDLVQKPTAMASHEILSIHSELIDKVKSAARATPGVPASVPAPALLTLAADIDFRARYLRFDVLLIGLSTGGPQAIRHIMAALPANFPIPIGIVVHMPVGYTELLAQKLNEISPLTVVEARDGEEMLPGKAVVARAGRHLCFRRGVNESITCRLASSPIDTPHRPSVNTLFQSGAETYGSRVLGVVMTGMGSDGTEGAAWIKAQGGTVLTEAEESCVVYGMPRSVVEAGLSDAVAPLGGMAELILRNL